MLAGGLSAQTILNANDEASLRAAIGTAKGAGEYIINVPSQQAADTLANLVGVTLDPTRGHVFIELRACGGAVAPHVSISADCCCAISHFFEPQVFGFDM